VGKGDGIRTRPLHEVLLQAYAKRCRGGWTTGPADGYFFQSLPYHLKEAGREEDLHGLLLSPEWL
jgi:hypothetical protein